jgi:hypothetical protein
VICHGHCINVDQHDSGLALGAAALLHAHYAHKPQHGHLVAAIAAAHAVARELRLDGARHGARRLLRRRRQQLLQAHLLPVRCLDGCGDCLHREFLSSVMLLGTTTGKRAFCSGTNAHLKVLAAAAVTALLWRLRPAVRALHVCGPATLGAYVVESRSNRLRWRLPHDSAFDAHKLTCTHPSALLARAPLSTQHAGR